jgi:hypothetical protein
MKYISINPYEGARRAFLGLNPNSTDVEWKEWCGETPPEEWVEVDELINLAAMCHAGAANKAGNFDDDAIWHFCFSTGFFHGLVIDRFGATLQET